MSSYRRALRQERARRFGQRHPRLALVIVILAMGGVLALCVAQIAYGTYLGRSWLIAAAAGIAAGALLSPIALIRSRRTPRGRLPLVWVLVTVLSASSIRLPFPVGRYDRPQAVVNVVHSALLGYLTVTITAIMVVLVGVLARFVRANGWRALPYTPEPPLPQGPRRLRGWPAWVLTGAVGGLVGCVILAAIGGSNPNDAPSRAAGAVGAVSLIAICVAGPAALYRWYRSRRVGPVPRLPRRRPDDTDELARELAMLARHGAIIAGSRPGLWVLGSFGRLPGTGLTTWCVAGNFPGHAARRATSPARSRCYYLSL